MSQLSHTLSRTLTVTRNQLLTISMLVAIAGCTEGPSPGDFVSSLVIAIEIESLEQPGAYRFRSAVLEGSAIGYEWNIDGADPLSGAEVQHTFHMSGQYSVVLVAHDVDGNTAEASSMLDVEIDPIQVNEEPVIGSVEVAAAPGTGRELSVERDLLCVVEASDADEDELTIEIGWTLDGEPLDVAGDQLSRELFVSGSEIRCAATAFDAESASETINSAAVTIGNAPTHIINETALNIVPESPLTDDDLTLSTQPAVEDADGDTPTFSVVWTVQNSAGEEELLHTEEGVTEVARLSANLTALDDRISLVITPVDSEPGESVNVGPVTVGNTAPEVMGELRIVARDSGSHEIVSGPALTVHLLSLEEQPNGVDDDGHSVVYDYRWERLISDDEWETLPEESADAVEVIPDLEPSATQKGNTYRLSVAPYDGHTRGGWVHSAVIFVENSAPIAANDNEETVEDVPIIIAVLDNDTDADNDDLFISEVSATENCVAGITPDQQGVQVTPAENTVGVVSFEYTASDGDLGTATASVEINVTAENDNPALAEIDNQTAFEDISFSFGLSASDVDNSGDELFFSVSGNPAWLILTNNLDGTAGLNGTPAQEDVASHEITVLVTDGDRSHSRTFTLTIEAVNDYPVLDAVGNQTASEDIGFSLGLTASDVDNSSDQLSFSVSGNPAWLALTDNLNGTASLDGTPNQDDVGSSEITVSVSDSDLSGELSFILTVGAVNDNPVLQVVPAQDASEDISFTLGLSASDIDNTGDELSFSVSGNPGWLGLTDNHDGTASLSGTPRQDDAGSSEITVSVNDDELGDELTFTLTVEAVNDEPTFEVTDDVPTAYEDTSFSYNVEAHDVDNTGEQLAFSVSGNPAWLSFTDNHNGTASLEGTPRQEDVGSSEITISVTDGELDDEMTFTLTVDAVNDNPVLDPIEPQTAYEDNSFTLDLSASDVDNLGDELAFSVDGNPTWLDFTDNGNGTGTFEGTPSQEHVGPSDITVTVHDAEFEDELSFTLTVQAVNDPPELDGIGDLVASDNDAFEVEVTAADVDNTGEQLTFEVEGNPAWLDLTDNQNGTARLHGTPTMADVGSCELAVFVHDGEYNDSETLTLTVYEVNNTPTMPSEYAFSIEENIEPGTIVGSVLAVDQEGTDPIYTGSTTEFEVNADSGEITVRTGVAIDYEASSEHVLTVAASDGNTEATTTVTISVTDVNEPVTFEQDSYVFTFAEDQSVSYFGPVTATDGDGLPVTYTEDSDDFRVFDNGRLRGPSLNYELQTMYEFTVTATDGVYEATTSVTVYVTDVEEIEVTIAAEADHFIDVATVNFTSEVLDGDGELTYSWEHDDVWRSDGYSEFSTEPDASLSLERGPHSIRLTVTDDYGTGVSRVYSLEIEQDLTPSIESRSVTAEPDRGLEPLVTTLSVEMRNEGNGGLTYSWLYGGEEISTERNPTVSLDAGDSLVYVEVTDIDGDMVSYYTRVTVIADTAPVFEEPIAHQASYRGETTDCLVAITTGGNYPFTYTWLLNGSDVGNSQSACVTFPVGTNELEVRVEDNDGDVGVYGPVTIDVEEDLLPEVTFVSTPPANRWDSNVFIPGYDGSVDVTAELSGVGGNEPYSYRWTLWLEGPYEQFFEAEMSYTFSVPEYDYYYMSGTVWDEDGDSVATRVYIYVTDRPYPVMALTAPATTGSCLAPLTFSARLADGTGPDDPPAYYRWEVDGVVLEGETGSSLSYLFEEGTYTVTAVIADAFGTEVSDSMEVRISDGDAPPEITRFTPEEDVVELSPVYLPHLPVPSTIEAVYSIFDMETRIRDLTVVVEYNAELITVVEDWDTLTGDLALTITTTGETGSTQVTVRATDTDTNTVFNAFTIDVEPTYVERETPALSLAFTDPLVAGFGHPVLPGLQLGDALDMGLTTFTISLDRTSDGHLVVWEDRRLDGCSGSDWIFQLTLEEARACDPGNAFDPTWAGLADIQTVDDFMALVPDAPELRFVVELQDIEAAREFATAADGTLTTQQYVFITTDGVLASGLVYEGFLALFSTRDVNAVRALNPLPDIHVTNAASDYDSALEVANELGIEVAATPSSTRGSAMDSAELLALETPPVLLIDAPVVQMIVEQRHGFRELDPVDLLAPEDEVNAKYGNSRQMTSGDFDGDGAMDVALCTSTWNGGWTLIYLTGADTPTTTRYEFPADTNVYSGCSSLSAGDLNGDAYSDLLVSQYTRAGWTIYSLFGGDGSLPNAESMTVALTKSDLEEEGLVPPYFSPNRMHLADLDGDGRPDLVTATGSIGEVLIARGYEGGVFSSTEAFVFSEPDCDGTALSNNRGFGYALASSSEVPSTLFIGVSESDVDGTDSGDVRLVAGDPAFFTNPVYCPRVPGPSIQYYSQIGMYLEVVEVSPGLEELVAFTPVWGRVHRYPLSAELPSASVVYIDDCEIGWGDSEYASMTAPDIDGDGFRDLVLTRRCDIPRSETGVTVMFGTRAGFHQRNYALAVGTVGYPEIDALREAGAESGDFLGMGTGNESAAIGLELANSNQGMLLFFEFLD